MSALAEKSAENLRKIRTNKPLIHNITNLVVMNTTANVLLAAGASPVMAHAENEIEEMVDLASSLVLNIGTPSDELIITMIKAGRKASSLGRPIVLDPVGAGATALRTNAVRALLFQTWVSVVRGNASEILSLSSQQASTKGVDSTHGVEEVAASAFQLARELGTTLAITGATDLITDGRRTLWVEGGHFLMPLVTGMGCSATALVGAFLTVDNDPVTAAASALAYFSVAGEIAGAKSAGPGSFMVHLLDALYMLSPEELEAKCRIKQE